MSKGRWVLLLGLVVLGGVGGGVLLRGRKKPDVPYVPTPHEVVDAMLEMAGVGPSDVVYDLGCGDGRIVVRAAQRFGARGVGVDIEPRLVRPEGLWRWEGGWLRLERRREGFQATLQGQPIEDFYLWGASLLLSRPYGEGVVEVYEGLIEDGQIFGTLRRGSEEPIPWRASKAEAHSEKEEPHASSSQVVVAWLDCSGRPGRLGPGEKARRALRSHSPRGCGGDAEVGLGGQGGCGV